MTCNLKSNLNISNEEKFLITILFTEKKVNIEFDNIDYEKLVKITSSHLLLPSLYKNLERKGFLHKIPKELKKYLSKIYNINKNRNKCLLSEAKKISKIMDDNYIKNKFLKGTELITKGFYKDIGERMVGDIDFLVSPKDILKVTRVLEKEKYFNNYEFKKFNSRHLPRFVNNKKIFAIEPHINVLSLKNKLIDEKELINKDCYSTNDLHLINILNYQINDYGNFKASYSLKTIYDFYTIGKIKELTTKKYIDDENVKKFFIITNSLCITKVDIDLNFFDKIFIRRIKFRYKSKIYRIIENLIIDFVIKLKHLPFKLLEFLTNNRYRRFKIKKLIKI